MIFLQEFKNSFLEGDPHRLIIETPDGNDITFSKLVNFLYYACDDLQSQDCPNSLEINGSPSYENILLLICGLITGKEVRITDSSKEGFPVSKFLHDFLKRAPSDINNYSFSLDNFLSQLSHVSGVFNRFASKGCIRLFTSGTTGKPAEVVLSFESICYQAVTVSDGIGLINEDRQLLYMPLNYVYGLSVVLTSLYKHSTLVESHSSLDQPGTFLNQILERNITVFSGVPFVYNLIVTRWGIDKLKLSNIRMLTQAGGHLSTNIKTQILDANVTKHFWIMYGQTEFGGRISQYNLCDSIDYIESVGTVISGGEFIISDRNKLQGDEAKGEIYVNLPSIAENIKDLKDPLIIEGLSYFPTGDIGYKLNNFLFITGRNKNFIKIAGKRLNVNDISQSFLNLSFISECVVDLYEGKFPIFLIGLIGEFSKEFNSQPDLSSFLEENSTIDLKTRSITLGLPCFISIYKGSIPRLSSTKIDLIQLKEKLVENYEAKKNIYIWM